MPSNGGSSRRGDQVAYACGWAPAQFAPNVSAATRDRRHVAGVDLLARFDVQRRSVPALSAVIVFVPLFELSLPCLELSGSEASLDYLDRLRITLAVVPLVFELAFLMWRGATPGKMMFGLVGCSYADGGRFGAYSAAFVVVTMPWFRGAVIP